MSSDNQLQAFADYESLYRDYHKLVIPQISATKVNMDIFPYSQRVSIRSSNTLINKALSGSLVIKTHLLLRIKDKKELGALSSQPTCLRN